MIRLDVPIPTCDGSCEEPCDRSCKGYRYLATSPAGFVQQLSQAYVKWGYFFWVGGELDEGKDPRLLDYKLLNAYPVEVTKHQRHYRRRVKKEAGLQYLRHGRHWVLIAREGRSPFFSREARSIRDIRESPYHFRGYSVGYKNEKAHVAISRDRFAELRREVLAQALRRHPNEWRRWFWELPFEAYGGVIQQARTLLGLINEARRAAGDDPLSDRFVRRYRKPVKPFAPLGSAGAGVASCPRPGEEYG